MAVRDDQGKLLSCHRERTSEEHLIAHTGRVPSPKWLVVEESHLAQWIKMTLERYVDQLTVCDPRHNRLIAQADFVDDRVSAIALTELARLGSLKEVYHPDHGLAELRSVFLHYYDLNHQVTRFKNKLKATFRQVGVPTPGGTVYEAEAHETWLSRLKPHTHLVPQARHCFELLDQLSAMKQQTYRDLVRRARPWPAFEWLMSMPGVAEVLASGYLAMIVTPHRFSNRSKLWRYGGLGFKRHLSDDRVYKKGASRSGHRALKWVVRQHFHAAVQRTQTPNRFRRQHDALLGRGLSETDARRMVCRSLLSTVRALWMKGESYRESPLS